MVSFLPPEQVQKFLTHILSPLYRIVDDDTIRDPQMGQFVYQPFHSSFQILIIVVFQMI